MKHTVRYFINSYNDLEEDTLEEVTEREFMVAEGAITYERHTMSENGVSQICLTKGLDVC